MTRRYVTVRKLNPEMDTILEPWTWHWECAMCRRHRDVESSRAAIHAATHHARTCPGVRAAHSRDAFQEAVVSLHMQLSDAGRQRDRAIRQLADDTVKADGLHAERTAAYLAALLVIAKLQRHIADLDAANRRLSDYVDIRERKAAGLDVRFGQPGSGAWT